MTSVVMEEIPDKVTLAVDISNCTGLCDGCHSPFLRDNVGEELTEIAVDNLFSRNFGVNCFLFLGEGNDHEALMEIALYIHTKYPTVALALYSGREQVQDEIFRLFDYVKLGPYRPSYGPLNNPKTNQRLYRIHHQSCPESPHDALPADLQKEYRMEDITSRFWRKRQYPETH